MDDDVIVIGSGPAGVSAAQELLAMGRQVTMLEAGTTSDAGDVVPMSESGAGRLTSATSRNTSPKLRTPKAIRMLSGYHAAYDVQTDGFELIGSLAVGGLSNVWGAGIAEWTDEFATWPEEARSTRDFYPRIAQRMGVSGPASDALTSHISPTISLQAPVPMTAPCLGLVERAADARGSSDFLLGGVRQAVITNARDGRHGCDLTGQCLTGCPREAIYSSRFTVRALSSASSFRIRTDCLVTATGQVGDRPFVDLVSRIGGRERLHAKRVFVAAGAPASTALASTMVPTAGRLIGIQSTPVIAFALAPFRGFPRGCTSGYAQAQGAHISWPAVPPLARHECLFGYVFNAGSLPVSELMDRLPRVASILESLLMRRIWARLVLATAFLPGRLTQHVIEFEPGSPASPPAIRVRGRIHPASGEAMPALRDFYRRRFAGLGWLVLPTSFQQAPAGSDVHYGASMPMSAAPDASPSPLATDTLGRLSVADRVHFVDGAVLPTLPGKPHTFTVMANAARIASTASQLD